MIVAVVGTVVGGCGLRVIEAYLGQSKYDRPKTIKAGEDYDRRWEDPDYVKMIHHTRAVEQETLGEIITNCECSSCNKPIVPRPESGIEIQKPRVIEPRHNEWWLNGYKFKIEKSVVPDYAHLSLDESGWQVYGYFTWTDPATGQKMGLRALPMPNIEPAHYYYSGDIKSEQKSRYKVSFTDTETYEVEVDHYLDAVRVYKREVEKWIH
jgi:hypothetical protein